MMMISGVSYRVWAVLWLRISTVPVITSSSDWPNAPYPRARMIFSMKFIPSWPVSVSGGVYAVVAWFKIIGSVVINSSRQSSIPFWSLSSTAIATRGRGSLALTAAGCTMVLSELMLLTVNAAPTKAKPTTTAPIIFGFTLPCIVPKV